ncbi:syncytin-1-like [Eleutherodactylus coqui]|uniref:syncytin-1-like n=1 Tax=Eleutherodactylus coqui TaxID=57060 RepID=UPI0034626307
MAIANPTFEDTISMETGFSDHNLWLEWMKYSAETHNQTDCYVCGSARPHLGTVPLELPENYENCFISLFTNVTINESDCEKWKKEYPILTQVPRSGEKITIYPGNYTCFVNYGTDRFLGNFTNKYCAKRKNGTCAQRQVQSLGDIYWICGDGKIRSRLEGDWAGECALAKALMPLHILSVDRTKDENSTPHRIKREVKVPGASFDPHVYIDTIGVPRGVPDEFKARDQVKAGFESLFTIVTANKNVAWINYIYYNQQRFVNYTRDALQGLADQLGPTASMTFQNRMALDMILAEKGGVCKMIGETCCTYIPDNTGPTGKVTVAIKKLTDLSEELKRNSGVTDPWDQYFSWLKGWQKMLVQVGVVLGIVLLVLLTPCTCIIPLIKKSMSKGLDNVTPTFPLVEIEEAEKEPVPLMPTTVRYQKDGDVVEMPDI